MRQLMHGCTDGRMKIVFACLQCSFFHQRPPSSISISPAPYQIYVFSFPHAHAPRCSAARSIETHVPSFHIGIMSSRSQHDRLLQTHMIANANDEWKVSAMTEMRMIDDIL